jgi:hypothetical protein
MIAGIINYLFDALFVRLPTWMINHPTSLKATMLLLVGCTILKPVAVYLEKKNLRKS